MLRARLIVLLIMANVLLVSAYYQEKQVTNHVRKLGKHHPRSIVAPPSPAPSPAEPLREGESGEEVMESGHHHHHHRSVEKSVAGGGAIVGALAALFLVAVFCYIRATRRRHVQPGSPTDSSSSNKRKMVESGSRLHS